MRLTNSTLMAIVLVLLLILRGKKRDKIALRRNSLLLPAHSPLKHLLDNGDSASWIISFGVNQSVFSEMHALFRNVFNMTHPKQRNTRLLTTREMLALTLFWLRSACDQQLLCFVCGLVPSSVSETLHESVSILHTALLSINDALVKFPSPETITHLSSIMCLEYPMLEGCYGFVDGTHIRIPKMGDGVTQHAYYCVRKASHTINNVFVYGVHGLIVAAVVNCPGSWHDSEVMRVGGIYEKLQTVPQNHFVIADSAFAGQKYANCLKTTRLDPSRPATEFESCLCSARQAVEWGMRGYKSTFRRFMKGLEIRDHRYRKQILEVSCMVYNLRTKRIGRNQISTVYLHLLDQSSPLVQ